MALPNYSVLMSVYKKEEPDNLKRSIESMLAQTVVTDDFVLICDGALTPELDEVIADKEKEYPGLFNVIRFETNQGLGHALQVGILKCKNEIIARMDSDDISKPDRCEKELIYLDEHPGIGIVGSLIEEFSEMAPDEVIPQNIERRREVPENYSEIVEFAKFRNPYNHPSVMYRRDAVLKGGNYQTVRYMQDYYLWIHMILAGVEGYNIQEPLVCMRVNSNFFMRKQGSEYRKLQINLFRYMRDQGFITNGQYFKSVSIRTASALSPNWMRGFMFKKVLRKS